MSLNAPARSALGAYIRSPLGVRYKGAAPAPDPGHVIIWGGDFNQGPLCFDHANGTYRMLGTQTFVRGEGVWWIDRLYASSFGQFFFWNDTTNTWDLIGTTPYRVQWMIVHDNAIHIACNDGQGQGLVYRWNDPTWVEVAQYRAAAIEFVNTSNPCDSYPPTDCLTHWGRLQRIASANGRLYLGGDGFAAPSFRPGTSAHWVQTQDGTPIAIFDRKIEEMLVTPQGNLAIKLNSTGGNGDGWDRTVKWRDTYPGCCYYPPDLGVPVHYNWLATAYERNWIEVASATAFDPNNVSDPYAGDTRAWEWEDMAWVNGLPFFSMTRTPATPPGFLASQQTRLITHVAHNIQAGSSIDITKSRHYDDTNINVEAVPEPNALVIQRIFKGDEAGGEISPYQITSVSRENTFPHGLYTFSANAFVEARSDRAWPSGLPSFFPTIELGDDGLIYRLAGSSDGGLYVINQGRIVTAADIGTSFERVNVAQDISRRYCFPALTWTSDMYVNINGISVLPDGAKIANLTEQCVGDTVTTKQLSSNIASCEFTFSGAHGFPGTGLIEILTSSVADYVGTLQILSYLSGSRLQLRHAFVGTATGTWRDPYDWSRTGSFTAVADGGLASYWYVYIETGTDPRPADLLITGNQSGVQVDFSGVPFDYREVELVRNTVNAQHRSMYDRIGPLNGPQQTHFYRIEYPGNTDPGWIVDEPVTLSR